MSSTNVWPWIHRAVVLLLPLWLAACGSLGNIQKAALPESPERQAKAQDVVLYAMGLIDTGYRFGGKNPEAGLDCSGMVSYVFQHAIGLKLQGSAADIARQGRAISLAQLRPGDLVFFNTANRAYSHVGIYIGEDRFAHAPNSGGKVRIDSLKKSWYATRFEEARTYFD